MKRSHFKSKKDSKDQDSIKSSRLPNWKVTKSQ